MNYEPTDKESSYGQLRYGILVLSEHKFMHPISRKHAS